MAAIYVAYFLEVEFYSWNSLGPFFAQLPFGVVIAKYFDAKPGC